MKEIGHLKHSLLILFLVTAAQTVLCADALQLHLLLMSYLEYRCPLCMIFWNVLPCIRTSTTPALAFFVFVGIDSKWQIETELLTVLSTLRRPSRSHIYSTKGADLLIMSD